MYYVHYLNKAAGGNKLSKSKEKRGSKLSFVTYPDKAVVEMEADEAGGDAGVLGEGSRDGLADERLGVRAAGVVESHPELRVGHRRQQA